MNCIECGKWISLEESVLNDGLCDYCFDELIDDIMEDEEDEL